MQRAHVDCPVPRLQSGCLGRPPLTSQRGWGWGERDPRHWSSSWYHKSLWGLELPFGFLVCLSVTVEARVRSSRVPRWACPLLPFPSPASSGRRPPYAPWCSLCPSLCHVDPKMYLMTAHRVNQRKSELSGPPGACWDAVHRPVFTTRIYNIYGGPGKRRALCSVLHRHPLPQSCMNPGMPASALFPRREPRPALRSSKVLREQDIHPGNRVQRFLCYAINVELV